MLNQPPIFLGGQGGLVGPLRMGYGNVVAANSVLRSDFPEDNKLIVGKTHAARTIDVRPGTYPNLHRIVGNNIIYIANLMALEQWYLHVRRPFVEAREFGDLVFSGLMDTLALARQERLKRLGMLADKARRPGHGRSHEKTATEGTNSTKGSRK
jgi:UDP-N-acetylglucosamine/UDP-N-acetylgalactosamine diphosphorylase